MTAKKLDALMRGEFRVSSGRTSDPVLAEAKRLAKIAIEGAYRAKGVKLADIDKAALAEAIGKLVPRFMEKARAHVAEAAELMADVEI